jgi:hypothetical protein
LSGLLVPAQGRIPGLLAALEMADDELAPVLTPVLVKLPYADAASALLQVLAALDRPEATAALRRAADQEPDPGVREICTLLLAQ